MTRQQLNAMSKAELIRLAKDRALRGRSGMTREQLIFRDPDQKRS